MPLQFPVYIQLGEVKILLHSILEPLAFFTGFRYFIYLRKKKTDVIQSSKRIWVLIAAISGALIGSRLIGGLEDPAQIPKADNVLIYFYMNKTVLGGFLGGLFGVELVKKIIGEKKATGDLFVYPIILALIIGRIGCFSAGLLEQTYGNPTHFFAGIDFGDGQLRHPVTLYEILFLLLLWGLLKILEKKQSIANGNRFKIFMISYILFRLLIDFIKPHYTFAIGLSTIQITCFVGLFWYFKYIMAPKKLFL
jgi:phosphatidylglycerol---prolipoprotein diacylglyceryl transferase